MLVVGEKVFFKKIGYVNICCLVHEPQRVFFSVQEQHGIFAVFFRCTVQEHPCIFAGFFSIFLDVGSGKIVVCAGVFLQCSCDALYRGATGHFCRVL